MPGFLDTLFGGAGFLQSLFRSPSIPGASAPKPQALPPRVSRLEPIKDIIGELAKPRGVQAANLPPPQARPILTPEQIPEIVGTRIPAIVEGDFLDEVFPQTADELSGFAPKDQHWLRSAEWIHVFSSNVSAVRYLWPDHNLEVEYLNGSIYRYYGVEPKVAIDFTYALSPGRYRWHVLGDPRWGTVHYQYNIIKEATKRGRPKPRVARERP